LTRFLSDKYLTIYASEVRRYAGRS